MDCISMSLELWAWPTIDALLVISEPLQTVPYAEHVWGLLSHLPA